MVCVIWVAEHVPFKFLCEALIKISYFVNSMYTCRRHAPKALTKVLYFDLVLHDSPLSIFKTDVTNIVMKNCGHQLQVFANMIEQVLLKGRVCFTNTCCCVSVLCVLYGIQHADQITYLPKVRVDKRHYHLDIQSIHPQWQSHKSYNALDKYPTMHHVVPKMCTCVHISVAMRCNVGYSTGVLGDLCNGCIRQIF